MLLCGNALKLFNAVELRKNTRIYIANLLNVCTFEGYARGLMEKNSRHFGCNEKPIFYKHASKQNLTYKHM